jgi:hypothetical protein
MSILNKISYLVVDGSASSKDSTDTLSTASRNVDKTSDAEDILKEESKIQMNKYKYQNPSRTHEETDSNSEEKLRWKNGDEKEVPRPGPFAKLAKGEHPLISRAKKYVPLSMFYVILLKH